MSNFNNPDAFYQCNDCQCNWEDFQSMHLHISRSGHTASDPDGCTYEVDSTIAMEVALFEDAVTYGMRKPATRTVTEFDDETDDTDTIGTSAVDWWATPAEMNEWYSKGQLLAQPISGDATTIEKGANK